MEFIEKWTVRILWAFFAVVVLWSILEVFD